MTAIFILLSDFLHAKNNLAWNSFTQKIRKAKYEFIKNCYEFIGSLLLRHSTRSGGCTETDFCDIGAAVVSVEDVQTAS